MGRKKRTPGRPLKQPVDSNPPCRSATEPDEDDDYSRAKTECKRALTTLGRGNHSKALRLIKESCANFKGSPNASALLYRIQGLISFEFYGVINCPSAKDRYFDLAMYSGRRAVELSPLSVEFRHFFANMLFCNASDEKEYTEVILECDRALSIECPLNPSKECVLDESQLSNETASERIGRFRDGLKDLIQRSNDRIEKNKKTNEIEAAVAAAKLLQQKKESPSTGGEANMSPLSGSASGDKVGERRKVVPLSTVERMDLVSNFWNSISEDVKEGHFRVTISALNRHYAEDKIAMEVLRYAVDCPRSTKGWRSWVCCRCNENFGDSESLMQHVFLGHLGEFQPKMPWVLPQEVDRSKLSDRVLRFDCKLNDVQLATGDASYSNPDKGSSSDDLGESWAVEIIVGLLQVLIRNKCFSTGHFTKVLEFIEKSVKELDSRSRGFQLQQLIMFLRELCQNAGLFECHEKSNESLEEVVSQDMEVERVVLDGDVISIAIDSQSNGSSTAEFNATGDVAAFVPVDIDSLLSWMYAGPSLKDQLAHWVRRQKQGMEILQKIENDFCILQRMCEDKIDLLGFAEGLQLAENLCINEDKRREKPFPRSFHSVLNDVIHVSGNVLDAITRILTEAEALNAAQFNILDREYFYVDDPKSTWYLYQMDTCIKATIEKQKDETSAEINKIDARIMRNVANRQQLEHKLEALAGCDYGQVIGPLIKSYMKFRLEELAEKDATEKSDAASVESPSSYSGALTKSGNAQSAEGTADATEFIGVGLQNEVGEYNCFLNVIIQSLWHIRQFHDEFLKRCQLDHAHVGDPCVVCALSEIFTALSLPAADVPRKPVSPTSLRMALSNLYRDSNFFQEGQMNDASEVLAVIFECLHKCFTHNSGVLNDESADGDCKDCLVHSLFGMDIFELMNCQNCGLDSRHQMYTSFFHNTNASALRMMKVMSGQSSLAELLDLVEVIHRLPCDTDAGGCGKLNSIHHFLSAPPHVFTTVMGWKNAREDAVDISATLAALSPEIDISVLYCGINQKTRHSLVSLVCYCGQHYYCFAYNQDQGRWYMYEDDIVKAIGLWEDVLAECEQRRAQPQLLFFEAVVD